MYQYMLCVVLSGMLFSFCRRPKYVEAIYENKIIVKLFASSRYISLLPSSIYVLCGAAHVFHYTKNLRSSFHLTGQHFLKVLYVLFPQTEDYISYWYKTPGQILFYVHFIYCLILGSHPAMTAVNRLTYCHELLSVPDRTEIFFLTTTTHFPNRHWAPPSSHPVSTWGEITGALSQPFTSARLRD